jgi:methylthioribose-1-phosphate isomerase
VDRLQLTGPPESRYPDLPLLADSVRPGPDGVHVLDRRRLPLERVWVRCASVEDVAAAIRDMVTQSSGPYFAVLHGLVLAAREASALPPDEARAALHDAAHLLSRVRRTNDHLPKAASAVLSAVAAETARSGPLTGPALVAAAEAGARAGDEDYRARCRALGAHTAALLPRTADVLTHCWADLYLVETVRAARRAGKRLRFHCTETRPYLQGTRLTAPTLAEMGVEATVLTDGAAAGLLSSGAVDVLLTAADRVTMDGHVVNKVGTLGLAVAARAFGVPFLAMVQTPDRGAATAADVPVEYRDGAEVLTVGGQRLGVEGVGAWYPAFDVTPPEYVTTVVTDAGPYAPDRLADYPGSPA